MKRNSPVDETRGRGKLLIFTPSAAKSARLRELPTRATTVHRLVTTSAAVPAEMPEWDEV